MPHDSDAPSPYRSESPRHPAPGFEQPRVPRPRPRSHDPGPLARALAGTDEPPAPGAVRAAVALWLTAVAAGVFGTVLAAIRHNSGAGPAAALGANGFLLRMAVLSATVLVAVRMRRGSSLARGTLAAGLVLLSLAAATAHLPDDGPTLGTVIRDAGVLDALSGAALLIHLTAAIAATTLMFRPTANAWFGPTRPS
ncbi:hypothetical protein AB0C93_00710 [Streptomyces sp. NPDC048518]|uniref:hypothetical protein n=1 Tax=Streptomyces sp. NPDC048518 TaxID=3155029 RepID=UPI00340FF245